MFHVRMISSGRLKKLAVVSLLVLVNTVAEEARMQLTTLSYNTEKLAWNSAHYTCTLRNGQLVNILDETTQYAVDKAIDSGGNDIWIGLHDNAGGSSDDWRWSDCQSLQTNWNYWDTDEPKDPDKQFCAFANSGNPHIWKTKDCTNNEASVCTKTQGDCLYENHTNSECTASVTKVTERSDDRSSCESLCEVTTNAGQVCWGFQYHGKQCTLLFHRNPFICDQAIASKPGVFLGIKRCFVCSMSHVSAETDQGLVSQVETINDIQIHTGDDNSSPALQCSSSLPVTTTAVTTAVTTATAVTVPTTTTLSTTAAVTTSTSATSAHVTPVTATTTAVSPVTTTTATTSVPTALVATSTTTTPAAATRVTTTTTTATDITATVATNTCTSVDHIACSTTNGIAAASSTSISTPMAVFIVSKSANGIVESMTSGSNSDLDLASLSSLVIIPTPSGEYLSAEVSVMQATAHVTLTDSFSTENTQLEVSMHGDSDSQSSASYTDVISQASVLDEQPFNSGKTTSFPKGVRFRKCICRCLEDRMDLASTLQDLALNKKNLSSYRRRLDSATDNRPSAKSLGASGVVLIVLSVLVILLMDANRLFWSKSNTIENRSVKDDLGYDLT